MYIKKPKMNLNASIVINKQSTSFAVQEADDEPLPHFTFLLSAL